MPLTVPLMVPLTVPLKVRPSVQQSVVTRRSSPTGRSIPVVTVRSHPDGRSIPIRSEVRDAPLRFADQAVSRPRLSRLFTTSGGRHPDLMSTPAPGPRQSRSHRRRRNPAISIVLVIVGMVVLFAAGFGLSVIIRGAGSGTDAGGGGTASPTPTGSATETPQPCVTVTVTPGAGLPTPSQVTTNVYNSTDRAGLAASTAEELQARGFIVGTIDNDPLARAVSAPAEIRHGPSGLASAQLMTYYIPGSVLVDDARTDSTIDTVLGQAFTAIAPQSEVDAALIAPSPSPSGPGCPTPTPTTAAPAPTSTPEPDTTGTAPAP